MSARHSRRPHDGVVDIVATNGTGLFYTTTNGAAAAHPMSATQGATSLAVGDFNGDSWQDIVTNGPDGVTVYLSTGSPSVLTGGPYSVTANGFALGTVTLNGTAVQASSVTWTEGTTVLGTTPVLTVQNLPLGVHTFTLTASNDIATVSATTTVTVQLPTGSGTGGPGPQGPQGIDGPKGDAGAAGPQGPKGDTGATGPQGPKGDTGAAGSQGPKGDKGEKGDSGGPSLAPGMLVMVPAGSAAPTGGFALVGRFELQKKDARGGDKSLTVDVYMKQ